MPSARAPHPRRRLTARAADAELRALRNPTRAAVLARFFQCGPGGYGEGDRFLGLTVPQVRHVARGFLQMPLVEIERLLESKWHEVRLLAVVLLAELYPRADATRQRQIYSLYIRRTDRINNWDLVDVSAPRVVGAHLIGRSRTILGRLARSRSVWKRRIAVLATLAFIQHGEFDDTVALARQLLTDPHDLMHKAVGWMLREVGKRDRPALERFLDRHAAHMPRTMLRYAVERLPRVRRQTYMARRGGTPPVTH